jgi:hypothetical protein
MWYDSNCPVCKVPFTGFTTLFCPKCDKNAVLVTEVVDAYKVGDVVMAHIRGCAGLLITNSTPEEVQIIRVITKIEDAFNDAYPGTPYKGPPGLGYEIECGSYILHEDIEGLV